MSTCWLALAGVAVAALLVAPNTVRSFDVVRYEEATIADIHAALSAKTLTCRALVQMYLERIATYDKKGPALKAIVVTNPDALKLAETLDARFVRSGLVGPIHCVPPHREGQLRDHRHADLRGIAVAEGCDDV